MHLNSSFKPDPSFIWGVAASAAQTEGAISEDGKGLSIWDLFAAKKRNIRHGHHLSPGSDFYNRYEQDLALMQHLGIRNFRFSTSWPRILPEGIGTVNQKGLDFYDRLTDACLEKNITPWITLYHWDLPHALEVKGGWTNREILHWFSRYVEVVVKRLGDRVPNWMILNEPLAYTGAGYFLGVHAPGKRGLSQFLPAVHHTTLCQAEGVRIVKALQPSSQVGTTFSCSWVTPHRAEDERDLDACVRVDALLNRLFVEPLAGKGYPINELKFLNSIEKYFLPGDDVRMQAQTDFIGIQNYTREVVRHSWITPYMKARLVPAMQRKVHTTRMNWEVQPMALYNMLHQFNRYKNLGRIFVTENGAAFHDQVTDHVVHDPERIHFLQQYIAAMHLAKEEGVSVDGYFVWSFTDNFEWSEGYEPRFGLVYVDYHTQKRIVKSSGMWYSRLIGGMGSSEFEKGRESTSGIHLY